MCGSQQNVSDSNVVLNTAVAEQFDRFANDLENVPEERFVKQALHWVRRTLREHQRVIFEGNGYSPEWELEAKERGLLNNKTTPDALPCMVTKRNIDFLDKYGVLSEAETQARYAAAAEQYAKLLNIEANTMVAMVRNLYLPALSQYSGDLATSVATKAEIGIVGATEKELVRTLTEGIEAISVAADELEEKNEAARQIEDLKERDDLYRDEIMPAMEQLRSHVDAMERVCGKEYWPVPSYNDMLFYV
jgi:glutamine synthetase